MTELLVPAETVPPWLRGLTANLDGVARAVEDRGGATERALLALMNNPRPAAVLVLFSGAWGGDPTHHGGIPADADVLLTQRAATLRNHSGQVAFPGGARDPGDEFPVGTALREAVEETGLDPSGVVPLATLGEFPVPPSGFEVSPVIAYWQNPSDVGVVDLGETARVVRVSLRDVVNPRNRFQVQRRGIPGRPYKGPAFSLEKMLVWGFTGGMLSAIAQAAGWEIPWDTTDIRERADELAKVGQE
jgi:8-oxo-dGTP pyrophosphatase MutT (NUDIX family)